MKKKFRIFFTWIIISMVFQFSIYALLENRIAKVLAPPANEPITTSLTARIPGSNLENPQLSYDKKYLATMDNGIFKVFNLKTEKLVFSKNAPSGNSKNLGVISYKWLPDRNTLIYFYARKNTAYSNPATKTQTLPSSFQNTAPASNSASSNSMTQPSSGTSKNGSTTSKAPNVKTQSTLPTSNASDSTSTRTSANKEDSGQTTTVKPNQETSKPSTPVPNQPAKPTNPQLTELYTLEFLDEDGMDPEDRKNEVESLNSYFPAGGEVTHMDFSTSTNLIYLTVQSGNLMKLLEIDVMKDGSNLTKNGETITNLAVSNQYGTLYIDSKQGLSKQIAAVKGWQRYTISKNENQVLLGTENGLVYLGEIKNNNLVKILTVKDNADPKSIGTRLETYWEGSIPFKNSKVVIGAKGQLIIYDQFEINMFLNGKVKKMELNEERGQTSYITGDGAELFQLRPEGNMTVVELKPLEFDN